MPVPDKNLLHGEVVRLLNIRLMRVDCSIVLLRGCTHSSFEVSLFIVPPLELLTFLGMIRAIVLNMSVY